MVIYKQYQYSVKRFLKLKALRSKGLTEECPSYNHVTFSRIKNGKKIIFDMFHAPLGDF